MANKLELNTLSLPNINDEYVFKGIFVRELPLVMRHRLQSYWSSYKNALLQKLAYHATLLTSLEVASRPRGHYVVNLNVAPMIIQLKITRGRSDRGSCFVANPFHPMIAN